MNDTKNFIEVIKRAAIEAVKAGQPSDFCFGTVTSEQPLKILVEQKMELTSRQLVLTRHVTDYWTEVTTDWESEAKEGGSGEASFASHAHGLKGRKGLTIHNSLKTGDKVVLVKKQGGQQYLVLDKVVS